MVSRSLAVLFEIENPGNVYFAQSVPLTRLYVQLQKEGEKRI